LSAIKNLSLPWLAVDVSVGLGNPRTDSISALCEEMPLAELHRGADNMAELMTRGPSDRGGRRDELGALPTIAIGIADNQTGALTALAAAGAVAYLRSAPSVTADQIASTIQSMLDDPAQTRAVGEAARALVDGPGGCALAASRTSRCRRTGLEQTSRK
jgi:UDP-2,4-diacetamido-2,4,6-trideoxy-beta-L-altropyranose hydrolase